jgi:hypothetical protein
MMPRAMNERVKELAVEADFMLCEDGHFYSEGQSQKITDALQRFAGLIIKDQQRPWVGLTDAEILEFWRGDHGLPGGRCVTAVELARFVEAKIKERNT